MLKLIYKKKNAGSSIYLFIFLEIHLLYDNNELEIRMN